MLRKFALTISVASTLGGCATGYNSISNPILGFAGGYWDQKGPGNLYKIGFAGNAFIKKEKVTEYILRRSAEVAQREGKNYFILYENLPAAVRDKRSDTKTTTTVTGKPISQVYILLVDNEEKDTLSANEILKKSLTDMEHK